MLTYGMGGMISWVRAELGSWDEDRPTLSNASPGNGRLRILTAIAGSIPLPANPLNATVAELLQRSFLPPRLISACRTALTKA